jgi:hypothetical protein
MKKHLRVINSDGKVYDIPLEVIAEMRAGQIAIQEKTEKDVPYSQTFEEEFNNAMDNDDVILEWSKSNITWDKVKAYSIRMDILKKDEYSQEWKENISVVFH